MSRTVFGEKTDDSVMFRCVPLCCGILYGAMSSVMLPYLLLCWVMLRDLRPAEPPLPLPSPSR